MTYDGCIEILENDCTLPCECYGESIGSLTVVGCHATSDDRYITIAGGDVAENVIIGQTGCENHVDWVGLPVTARRR